MPLRALMVVLLAIGCSRAQPATTETQRLATLGRVWGFLKYHHPTLAKSTLDWDQSRPQLDWDQVLLGAIPKVRDAASFRTALAEVVDRPGRLEPGGEVQPTVPAVAWLGKDPLVDVELAQRLDTIRRAPRTGHSYQVTTGGAGNAEFPNELAYADSPFPSTELRLLALFRYWNAINYFFPYREQVDGGWEGVLEEFIPRFVAARDAREYHELVAELGTRISDGHGYTRSKLLEARDPRGPKLSLRVVEGRTVVVKRGDELAEINVGDVVTAVNGVPVATARERVWRGAPGSNRVSRDRVASYLMLRTSANHLELEVERDGARKVIRVPAASTFEKPPDVEPWKRIDGNIGYIAMKTFKEEDIAPAMAALADTRALVFDMRAYPEFILFELLPYLHATASPFVKFTQPDVQLPGTFANNPGPPIGGGRDDVYRGKIAVLVDETTMSRAEYVTMALQSVPGAIVVGSQTAGADGNVTSIALPGDVTTSFSGIGIYYPDGRVTQRDGIAIDIVVTPTIAGLRAGRDEVLDRAIAALRSSR